MKNYIVVGIAVLALILSTYGLVGGNQSSSTLGNATPGTRFPHGITIGLPANSPSNIAKILSGTCTILANTSIAATSTANFDCAITGVTPGDIVTVASQASSTLASQFVIKGVTASSTAGFVTFSMLNLTGAAAVPAATVGVGSSTQYQIVTVQ